jgi:CRP-like cAMP-binding protein
MTVHPFWRKAMQGFDTNNINSSRNLSLQASEDHLGDLAATRAAQNYGAKPKPPKVDETTGGRLTPLSRKLRHANILTTKDVTVLEGLVENIQAVNAREDIVREGQTPRNVRLILEGFAYRYSMSRGGQRTIIAHLLPGDFCNLDASILGPVGHTIAAVTACVVADFPQDQLDEARRGEPRIARALRWATLVDEAISSEWLANVGQRPADRKLAHLICELRLRLEVIGLSSTSYMKLPFTQEELGDSLGISSVHFNRVFQQLRQANLVVTQGRGLSLRFPDLKRLEEYCEFNPDYLHLSHDDSEPAAATATAVDVSNRM